jgi:hypothetical protein
VGAGEGCWEGIRGTLSIQKWPPKGGRTEGTEVEGARELLRRRETVSCSERAREELHTSQLQSRSEYTSSRCRGAQVEVKAGAREGNLCS